MAMSARSLVVAFVSKPTNTRIDGFATARGLDLLLRQRHIDEPESLAADRLERTALRGPAVTNSDVGAIVSAASTASPVGSADWNTCASP